MLLGRGQLKLISRNGFDRTPLFRGPFRKLAASGRPIVFDGEIAVPDERGVTHIDWLSGALAGRQPERLTYFAFDVLYFDGHDLRRCRIEERKSVLRQALDEAACERLVYVDHIIGNGVQLFERVHEVGAERIVSKRLGSLYRGRETRDWLKTKCHQTGEFVITGFEELGEGHLEAVYVAEEIGGAPKPAGRVQFGFAGKGLWSDLDALRWGPARRAIVPVAPTLRAEIKFFDRYQRGWIRDGVILSLDRHMLRPRARRTSRVAWSCDHDEVISLFDAGDATRRAP
jgi:bifunctional non-homologous end joining protein LigD